MLLFTLTTRLKTVLVLRLSWLASVLMHYDLLSGLVMPTMLALLVTIRRACSVTLVVPLSGSVRILLRVPARSEPALLSIVVRVLMVACMMPPLGRRVASDILVARARNCNYRVCRAAVLQWLCN